MQTYLTEEELLSALERHKAGDSAMLGDCASRLGKGLYYHVRKGIELDECIQECYLIMCQKANYFDPTKGRPFNYFTTVCLNKLKQLYRERITYDRAVRNAGRDWWAESNGSGRRVSKGENPLNMM